MIDYDLNGRDYKMRVIVHILQRKRGGSERCSGLPKVMHRGLEAVGKQNKISNLLAYLGSLVLGHVSELKDSVLRLNVSTEVSA